MNEYAVRYIPGHVCIDKGKTKLKFKANWSGRGQSTRPVIFIHPDGNTTFYESAADAIEGTGFSRSYVYASLRGKYNGKKGDFEYAI